jgi:probable HAF family extracellular repeat protein
VGSAHTASGEGRATLWQNGLATNLGTLGGDVSTATAINRHGVVVGGANAVDGGDYQAFIWQGGTMRSLGSLGDDSIAIAINDFGVVVGMAESVFGVARAFVAGAQGMHDLNAWLAVAPVGDQRLTQATDVNRHGQILARNVAGFAMLLTPQGTLRWAASGDASFTDGGAWDSGVGQGPSRFLDVVLSHPSSQTVEMSESAEVRSLVVGGGGGAGAGQMRLRLSAGAVLTSTNPIVIERSGTLTGDGVLEGNVQLAGTLQVGCGFSNCSTGSRLYQDGRYTFNVGSGGLVTGSGLLEAGLNVATGGEVRAGAGQLLRLVAPGGQHFSNGVLEVRDGGEVRIGGNWQNRFGTVRIDGGTVRFDAGLDNRSQVHIGFGGADIYGQVDNAAGARIIASGGNQTTFWDGLTNNGEVRASAGSRIVYFGPVNGAGSFTTNGAGAYHRFEGGFSPGNSPADVVLGTTQLASTLTMELGGTTPGTEHDRITFTGLLTLDAGAQLEVVLIDGFVPQLGQVFDLFVFQEGVSGTFESMLLPALGAGWDWDTSALYTAGDLRVAAAVPEPATWLSLCGGLFLLVARRRFGASPAAQARPLNLGEAP